MLTCMLIGALAGASAPVTWPAWKVCLLIAALLPVSAVLVAAGAP